MPTSPEGRGWKKLLYLGQPYPDNYTDCSFLDQLKRNTTVAKYSPHKLFSDFSLIAFYGLLLLIINCNFSAIHNGIWNAYVPTLYSSLALALCSVLSYPTGLDLSLVKLYVVICMLLLLFSPALRSLTQSTSLDSIRALLFILTCANIVCHDYSLELRSLYKSVLSTNLSFANAIVMASRLQTSMSVFSFLVFSIQISVLAPLLDFHLRKTLALLHYCAMAFVLATQSTMLYVTHGSKVSLSYLVAVAFVLFGLPWYFAFLQKYKNELQGPWDTAKPVVRSIQPH